MLLFILSIIILIVTSIPIVLSLRQIDQFKTNSYQRKKTYLGAAILTGGIITVILFNIFLFFITDYFWFTNLGYARRFWTVFYARIILFTIGSVSVALFLYINYAVISTRLGLPRFGYGVIAIGVVSFFFGFWPASQWNEILLYSNQVCSTVEEPILGRSISFYLFSLPLYSAFLGWFIAAALAAFVQLIVLFSLNYPQFQSKEHAFYAGGFLGHFLFLCGILSLIAGWYHYLQIHYLLYGNSTAVIGAGYTDTHVNIYANAIIAAVFATIAIMLFIGAFSDSFRRRVLFISPYSFNNRIFIYPVVIFTLMVISLWLIPLLVQNLYVSPNEITLEKPYLQNNINFTRNAYSINKERITEELYPIGRTITTAVARDNKSTLMNVRLWDWRALLENLRQQQEIGFITGSTTLTLTDTLWMESTVR